MIKANDLYEITKLPVDEHLLDKLIERYLSIPYAKMSNGVMELPKLLYDKINILDGSQVSKFNKDDLDNFIKVINDGYIKAGKPFDPKKYNGVTNPLSLMAGWNIFQSWHLLGTEKIKSKDIAHRFYFGISNDKVYELSHLLYDKFKKKGIPFYFKTDADDHIQRTDNLVLYTSTPLLEKTLEVLEELQKERPDLLQNCCEPSILVGRYSDKIGYATEDKKSTTSYTDLICNTFLNAIEKSLIEYTNGNYNPQMKTLFQQKMEEYKRNNKDVSLKRVKYRILFDILIKNDATFKQNFFLRFKNELEQKGLDVNNICFNNSVKQDIEQEYGSNKKIVLPNGTVMTQEEYLKRNNVMRFIPLTAKVTLGNGQVMTGEEFIKGVLKRAGQFNTFQELFIACNAKVDPNIDYKAEREKQEKAVAVGYDKQHEEIVVQISQGLLREEIERQMFSPGTTKEELEKARKLIEAQMTGVDIDVVEDNSITKSSIIKR